MAARQVVRRVVVVSIVRQVLHHVRTLVRVAMAPVRVRRVQQNVQQVHMHQRDLQVVAHVQVVRSIVRRKQAAVRR